MTVRRAASKDAVSFPKKWLTFKETCAKLELSDTTIKRLFPLLKPRKWGNRLHFDPQLVQLYIDKYGVGPHGWGKCPVPHSKGAKHMSIPDEGSMPTDFAHGRGAIAMMSGALALNTRNEEGERAAEILKSFSEGVKPLDIAIRHKLTPEEVVAWQVKFNMLSGRTPQGAESTALGLRLEYEGDRVRLTGVIMWPPDSKDSMPVDVFGEWVKVDTDDGQGLQKGEKNL